MSEDIIPGSLVDIYSPRNNHKWVWVTGYQIFNPKESNKDRHKRLASKKLSNPITGKIEECYAVKQGAFVFPVVKSHVRKSSRKHKDVWNPTEYRGAGVVVKGFVVADESDRADLESLDGFTPLETPES